MLGEFAHGGYAVLHLVAHFLGVEEAHALQVHRADFLEEGLQGVVLATQTDDEHAGRIGMAYQASQDLAGVPKVVAEL